MRKNTHSKIKMEEINKTIMNLGIDMTFRDKIMRIRASKTIKPRLIRTRLGIKTTYDRI